MKEGLSPLVWILGGPPRWFFFFGGGLTTSLSSSPGKSGVLLRAIGARIREQLGIPWVPPACRTPQLQRLQVNFGGGPDPPPPIVGG